MLLNTDWKGTVPGTCQAWDVEHCPFPVSGSLICFLQVTLSPKIPGSLCYPKALSYTILLTRS